ncbi:hypothetical protein INS49_013196 [Diaporthe citri]|uniref:uncharacterized protein n=1 Tax=Diaporthe citri TaxID=83186 RepID=UPI001C825C58|nr:uncharacterized protein INS49_013196 [Diaporthe citri]KAG6359673.1 hypothetical protein INS49_013196 [Diaporthe citri]
MSTQGLRVPPRPHSPGNENDKDTPSAEHVERAESTSAKLAQSLSKAKAAIAKISARNQLAQARFNMGFAAELPLDGLGVVHDKTSLPRRPLHRSKYNSPTAMKRTQSQRGVPGPSSQAGSAMMERTQSQARVPDPNSQEYADMVAEPNQRLEELSPYTPDDRVPDTPMPDMDEGPDDKKPPPLPSSPPTPRLPPSQGGGYVPQAEPSRPYHAPILRAKRDSSEISVVQVATSEFSVVDPHDFIEALSWSDSVAARDAQVIRRLREQTITPRGALKKLLVPFSLEVDIFLAVVDLGAAAIQIIDPRTQEDLRTRDKDDGFETSTFVYEFIHTMFPDECPSLRAWTILFERTDQAPEPINEPGLIRGRYVNELGSSIKLRSILPFFFEVVRIVCNVITRKRVDDVALLKRLFALFDGTPRLKTNQALQRLREDSRQMLRSALELRVRKALTDADVDFRTAVAWTRADSPGHCTPRQLLYLKLDARRRASTAVTQAHLAAGDLMAQHGQLRLLVEGMSLRCVMARSGLQHTMVSKLTAGWFYSKDGRREIWEPEAALNQFRSQGLNALARRLQAMKTELEHWVGMVNEHLDSSKMR